MGRFLTDLTRSFTLRFQSSVEHHTTFHLTSPQIDMIWSAYLHLTVPWNALLVREKGHHNETGQEKCSALSHSSWPVTCSHLPIPHLPSSCSGQKVHSLHWKYNNASGCLTFAPYSRSGTVFWEGSYMGALQGTASSGEVKLQHQFQNPRCSSNVVSRSL